MRVKTSATTSISGRGYKLLSSNGKILGPKLYQYIFKHIYSFECNAMAVLQFKDVRRVDSSEQTKRCSRDGGPVGLMVNALTHRKDLPCIINNYRPYAEATQI